MRRLLCVLVLALAVAVSLPALLFSGGHARAPAVRALPRVSLVSWSVNWYAIALCESGARWHLNTGNGFYGGLQFSQPTWRAYKRSWYPWRADLAAPWMQKRAAERVLASQGIGAWPVCGARG